MIKNVLIIVSSALAIGAKQCNNMDSTLTLDWAKSDSEVIQRIPANQVGRDKNTLYLAPRKVQDVEFNTPQLDGFINHMYDVMVAKSGVGIAANQVGKRLQIFIIEAKADNPRYKVLGPVEKQIFINPKITKASEKKKNFWHGCLSANGEKRGNLATYEWIEYECQNNKGEIQRGRLDGFAAVIFQHEFRHMLNGTYLDVAKQFLSKPELDKQIEMGKLPFFETAPDSLPHLIGEYHIGETLDEFHARKK
jgi:peptide deformylase